MIQANDVHIAVLKETFRTTNYQSGGFITWNENEAVQVKHNGVDGSPLWYCLKLDESTDVDIDEFIYNGLVAASSQLDFIEVNWVNVNGINR